MVVTAVTIKAGILNADIESADQLPLLLSAAGFERISRFGELSRTPFGLQSRVQVCLCRRTPL